jgi:predicted outer membrane protein
MVGVVTTTMILATVLFAAAGARVAVARSQGAADAAAVAGAAAAVGLVRDEPCAAADRTARGNGARVSSCDVADAVVRVRVQLRAGPFDVEAAALAGPPTADT